MTKEEMIDLLNGDLSNEYKHMHFYLHSSFMVQGLHRVELGEFLAEAAVDEFKHVQEFAKMIVGLGGKPTTEVNEFRSLANPFDILSYALKMEEEVVANYVQRMQDAKELGGVDGAFIEIFLEGQILDSRQDLDELRLMTGEANL